jgi:hypothetical protein
MCVDKWQVHGCYEAMLHGMLERTLQDLTDSCHVRPACYNVLSHLFY